MRSALEIFDLTTGRSRLVLESERLIEAPNWAPDGGSLLVNGAGRLYRIPLDRPDLVPVESGFAIACNNDHGFSPDGRWIAISDESEAGSSCIYLVPAEGARRAERPSGIRPGGMAGHPTAARSLIAPSGAGRSTSTRFRSAAARSGG